MTITKMAAKTIKTPEELNLINPELGQHLQELKEQNERLEAENTLYISENDRLRNENDKLCNECWELFSLLKKMQKEYTMLEKSVIIMNDAIGNIRKNNEEFRVVDFS